MKGVIKEVSWDKSLDEFPKLFQFDGNKWEWFAYEHDPTGKVSYILIFSKLPTYDPNYSLPMPKFDAMFTNVLNESCECGAKHTSFPQIHMMFCPKWRKNP